jgi:hypothetical protein
MAEQIVQSFLGGQHARPADHADSADRTLHPSRFSSNPPRVQSICNGP